jgi:YVTN family beta-propeller protein
MKHLRPALAAALLACAPCAAPAAIVTFAAPAGTLPASHLRGALFDAVLPSGRIVTPVGTSVLVGANALGAAVTPDGRYAIVSNDDVRTPQARAIADPSVTGGFSLAVVDLGTMRVVDRYAARRSETFWSGIAALPDPAQRSRTLVLVSGGPSNDVYAFTLDANGRLAPDAKHVIALPQQGDPVRASGGHVGPATIVVARDGARAYVVDDRNDTVATIDTATRKVLGAPQPVGFAPFGAALAGDRLAVTNEGMLHYDKLPQPQNLPAFRTPYADLTHASALSLLGVGTDGTLGALPATSVAMDPAPDGVRFVGGAHPTAIATTPNGAYAYVAMTNVDRIATVALRGTPRVVGGTELRLFARGPYGTQPAALALSKDGSRLYVALAGLDAVAVIDARDPVHLHRLGLIPTGWYPTALALAADDRTLYVLNTKGFGHEQGARESSPIWSTLQKIDLGTIRLNDSTMTALKNARRVVTVHPKYPKTIRNVVVILAEDRTFDAMLGDLGAPYGDPSLATFGRTATPNLHALAQTFGLAANFYADAAPSGGHQFATSGLATLYTERTLAVGPHQDPEDAPRLGSIFNALVRHRMPFRDYGELLRLSGYDDGGTYALSVPGPAALAGHIDTGYLGWNPKIDDEQRAQEFIRDYGSLVAAGKQPRYTQIWLPNDGDRALGEIVQYLSHLPSWKSTAIFVMPSAARAGRDHVDVSRTYALLISPYAKRHFVGMRHLSTVSVLKTSEQILGLGALSLGDLLATDMSDFFTTHPDYTPYTAAPAASTSP